ncbi:50S ribosomal protein L11 methyltransferase [Bacillus fonticola]|uniref:50S ribosomal protein L11 methyltransferase n=1 Tax=Bacillus fonticola TaxID=2728853 RepID=UPI001474DC85|nr:50S ribosomal protein L11 methyltransferase [Bacillus fonticola]
MKWTEMSIHTTQDAVEPVSNILHEAGASGVVIEDPFELQKERAGLFGEIYQLDPGDYPEEGVIVKAYLPVTSFLAETVEEVKNAIENLLQFNIDIGTNEVTLSEVNEEDWATAWKTYYHPVKISEHFTIVPTWEDYTPVSEEEQIIELDPGMAFGTGTHPTTVLCIQALEHHVKKGDVVFDVGTGSGVLSIAAAKLGASDVRAFDLDAVAVTTAIENVKLNNVHDKVSVAEQNLLEGIEGHADVIVANLLAEILILFPEKAFDTVRAGGTFISSGIIRQKKELVKSELQRVGFIIEETLVMEDWVALIAKKPE